MTGHSLPSRKLQPRTAESRSLEEKYSAVRPALNYMAYTRGSRIEFNDWEKLGITGWDWNTIRDAVNASEAWAPPSDYAKLHNADDVAHNHGSHGYIKTTAYSYYYDLVQPFFHTMNKLGVATNHSEASGDLIGIWTYTASVDPQTNTRSYSTNAYYDRVSSQPNIVCLTGAYAAKVVMSDGEDGALRALGVEFYGAGQLFSASVRCEVILAAGQSRMVFRALGIGTPSVLRKLGIPLKIDLPGVGENFQDHFTVTLGAELSRYHITADDLSSESFAQKRLEEYRETRQGMLSSTLSTLVFIPTSAFIPADKMKSMLASLDRALQAPEIKNLPYKQWYELQRAWLENDGVAQLEIILFPSYTHVGCTRENASHYTMSVFLQHAWSRGSVHATSPSIFDPPEIDPAILDSPGDIDMIMLLEAVNQDHRASPDVSALHPIGMITSGMQLEWDYISNMTGTASMLPRSANGVVDNELKVYGTENLRVADASIFPIHLGTHPQATLYGLAHRAADIITSKQKVTESF
ncbi:hypothetical protein JVU11DRAFT_8387 [Chiua virens]|nr:hypothetical protein JVU11DRAFT_8387 [Chiua virens]